MQIKEIDIFMGKHDDVQPLGGKGANTERKRHCSRREVVDAGDRRKMKPEKAEWTYIDTYK